MDLADPYSLSLHRFLSRPISPLFRAKFRYPANSPLSGVEVKKSCRSRFQRDISYDQNSPLPILLTLSGEQGITPQSDTGSLPGG
jgi:hypothetical protein